MKRFIEVTDSYGINKYYINISYIASFGDKWILMSNKEYPEGIKETYEEIKELIKNAK